MDLPDIQQWNALKEGNETAFEMFFKTYYQQLCRYAYTFTGDKDEAEEIVQTAFLSVWEKRALLDVKTSLKSYLYSMVRNSSLNLVKHEKVKQKYAVDAVHHQTIAHENVAQAVHASELELQIDRAIAQLPEQCRMVFKLSRFEELKYAEIAEQLNISVKTVENHMGKALKLMREHLRDYLPLLILFLYHSN